ncbi:hypothetical protein PIB30_098382 [Stylosanthes scabra]|uniref:Uncharacterized protein n=1 Tax=Stylosanthes scabra TaxID=79078 RepID=A0ABU6UXB6_9FABA|nr:hypothetical protein [Stylosanthes scabra]
MANGGATTPTHGAQGQDTSADGRHANFDEQGAQEQDMNWKEALDEAETDDNIMGPPLAPPTVTPQTMRGASAGTTSKFQDFMPTPRAARVDALRWPLPHFNPPASTS